ncbi:MAG: DUF4085 family protein [Ruminococcaceae bacterium]|nr:DUF4085 family protein [Oscillospiraceae bacterium]
MKYFTREWYNDCQLTSLSCVKTTDSRAEEFSEAYFEELYAGELNAHIRLMEEVSQLTGAEFDQSTVKRNYENGYRNKLEACKNGLPEEILSDIADVRVFALGVCTEQIKSRLKAWRYELEKKLDASVAPYLEYAKKLYNELPVDFRKYMNFHDEYVKQFYCDGDSAVIEFEDLNCIDATGEIIRTDMLIFENVEIIEQDNDIVGAVWLYDELYKTADGYELHVFLSDAYLTLLCTDIRFVCTAPRKLRYLHFDNTHISSFLTDGDDIIIEFSDVACRDELGAIVRADKIALKNANITKGCEVSAGALWESHGICRSVDGYELSVLLYDKDTDKYNNIAVVFSDVDFFCSDGNVILI